MAVPTLRGYQQELEQRIYKSWGSGKRNVLAVLPTGAGKTVTFGKILSDHRASGGFPGAIAHRRELVGQISMALARFGVRHRVVGPPATVKSIENAHMRELGRRHVDANASAWVAGVDTLVNMAADNPLLQRTTMWVQDEAHHVLRENKWGRAADLLPNAYGLGVTATPGRADGKGLGRAYDGLFDEMVVGPQMRDLIEWGYLTDYDIALPESNLDLSNVPISAATGDFSAPKLVAAVHGSSITGDVVREYLRLAPGKLGITFAVSVEDATDIAAAFRAAGVPAEVVTGDTPPDLRDAIIRRFAAREIMQLVNVDLFGEGFDLPAIEVVSMARPTASFNLYAQQFGRVLRLMVSAILMAAWDTYTPAQRKQFIAESPKPRGLIIDHVGNMWRHEGPPDRPRSWSLASREKRGASKPADEIPLRVCANKDKGDGTACAKNYERYLPRCPYCGHMPVPAERSRPEYVEGDLTLLDPAILAAIRGEVSRIDGDFDPKGLEGVPALAARKRHVERQDAQRELREDIALWAGAERDAGLEDAAIYRKFWHLFATDVVTAQTLGANAAAELSERIRGRLSIDGIVKKA